MRLVSLFPNIWRGTLKGRTMRKFRCGNKSLQIASTCFTTPFGADRPPWTLSRKSVPCWDFCITCPIYLDFVTQKPWNSNQPSPSRFFSATPLLGSTSSCSSLYGSCEIDTEIEMSPFHKAWRYLSCFMQAQVPVTIGAPEYQLFSLISCEC